MAQFYTIAVGVRSVAQIGEEGLMTVGEIIYWKCPTCGHQMSDEMYDQAVHAYPCPGCHCVQMCMYAPVFGDETIAVLAAHKKEE